jgi:hypothetical protein
VLIAFPHFDRETFIAVRRNCKLWGSSLMRGSLGVAPAEDVIGIVGDEGKLASLDPDAFIAYRDKPPHRAKPAAVARTKSRMWAIAKHAPKGWTGCVALG